MRKIVPVLALSLCCSASAWADETALPAPVATALAELEKACADAGGKASTTNAIKRTDLSGDGKTDFVLDASSITCVGAPSVFGDRDKPVRVFVADGAGGAELSYSNTAHSVKLEGQGPEAKVWLLLTGEGCGKKKARFFDEENYCDRPLVWNEATKKVELAPLSAVRKVR